LSGSGGQSSKAGHRQRNRFFDVMHGLFGKLEASLVTNRQEFIDGYFATLVSRIEMTTLWTEPAYYEHLRTS